jgi:hypothetical protein
MNITIKSTAGFRFGKKIAADKWLFDTDNLTEGQRNALEYWCRANPGTVIARFEIPKPAPVVVEPEPVDDRPEVIERPVESVPFVDEIAEDFKKDLQIQVDQSMAQHQLNFWGRVHGLRDSEKNQRLITEWLDRNVKGYLFGEGIDVAIANLNKQLDWDAPKPIATPAPKATDEVLGTLPNDEEQLSLKHLPSQTASTAQWKDYLARFRAANNLQFTR